MKHSIAALRIDISPFSSNRAIARCTYLVLLIGINFTFICTHVVFRWLCLVTRYMLCTTGVSEWTYTVPLFGVPALIFTSTGTCIRSLTYPRTPVQWESGGFREGFEDRWDEVVEIWEYGVRQILSRAPRPFFIKAPEFYRVGSRACLTIGTIPCCLWLGSAPRMQSGYLVNVGVESAQTYISSTCRSLVNAWTCCTDMMQHFTRGVTEPMQVPIIETQHHLLGYMG